MSLFDSNEIFVLSSSGSHSYLRVQEGAGLGSLFYREFSDWKPTGPLFNPVLALAVESGGVPLSLQRTSYHWQGDLVEQSLESGNGIHCNNRIGYIGHDVILAEAWISNKTSQICTLKLSGKVSDQAKVIYHDASAHGFLAAQIQANMGNMWGKDLLLNEMFVMGVNQGKLEISNDGSGYGLTLEIPPHTDMNLCFGLAPRESAETLFSALENPEQARQTVRQDLQSWMDDLVIPSDMDQKRAELCRQSWFWIWYSTQRAKGQWSRDIITPSRAHYARGVWLWDSGFHIRALLQGQKRAIQLAADQIEVLCANLIEGHLPREVWVEVTGMDLQAPGILTWAALEVFERTGDLDFLKRVYPAFAANNNWFYKNRSLDDLALCWWDRTDSGWDTSQRWDNGYCLAIDLNAWLYMDHLLLAKMCDLLGKRDAEIWHVRANQTRRLMNEYLWNEADGCYYDVLLSDRKQTGVKSPAMYWPLFAGVAEQSQAEKMMRFLSDPQVFGSPWPMPCVSLDHPAFEPDNYWRGPVWINLNYITILGLYRYGFKAQADELTRKTLEVIEKNPVPFEYYNPLTGQGIGAPNYMWTAALHLALALGKDPAPVLK